jgi:hypothetical protein
MPSLDGVVLRFTQSSGIRTDKQNKTIYLLQLFCNRGVVVSAQLWVDFARADYPVPQATIEHLIVVENSVLCVRVSLPVLAVFISPLRPVQRPVRRSL